MSEKYAVQSVRNGQLIDYCETQDQVARWLSSHSELESVEIAKASKIEVIYTELGGPAGYGHQEPSFTTHGALKKCVYYLCLWMQSSARVFGPDWRDVRDYFNHCRLYVNGEDKSNWLFKQVTKIQPKTIFV